MFAIRGRRLLTVQRVAPAAGIASAALCLPFAAPCQPVGPLDELIVTARKHPEAISRVPMSIQALPGDLLDSRGLSSLYELQYEVPGLVVNNRGMFGAGLALRGVTDEGGGSVAVASHFNGVYLGRSNLALTRQFDVERVEVLKGPQGTLYGRNATGGAINVITRAPEHEFGAAFEGAYGSFATARMHGHVNLAGETVTARIAAAASDGQGFIRNSVDNRRFGEQDYGAIRASLSARPTQALTIDAVVERVEDDGASGELWLPRKDYLPDPGDIRLTTVTLANPYLEVVNDIASVNIAYDVDGLTLRSITGYARNVTNDLDDCAGIPQLQGCVRGVRPLRYEQRSQEFRVESIENDSLDWLAGVYYFNADETQNFHTSVGPSPVPLNDYTATAGEEAYAVFGDATHALGNRWRVSAGLRFSREEQSVAKVGSGRADEPVPTAAADSWDETSWRLGFELAPSDRVLVYAHVSTGFKSGGITTDLLPNGEFDGYDEEELLAYEAGVSTSLSGGRTMVRASAFYYDFEDMQVRTIVVLANSITSVIDNAGEARIYGMDASATTSLSDRVTFSGSLVWMPKREFVDFIAASSGADLSGNTISRAPEWSVSTSIGYRMPIGSIGELSADVDYSYRSEFFFTKENDLITSQDGFGLLDLLLRFGSATDRWYVFALARNLLDEDYFDQVLLQSSPGYPANYEAGFGWRF